MSSLAEEWGFPDYKAIYLDAGNAAFRKNRPNPNIIFPGDVLLIPDLGSKEHLCPTDQRHRFVLTKAQVYLRLCLQDDLHQPYRNARYHLRVGIDHYHGSTDDHGMVERRISADASNGEITIFTAENDSGDTGYTFLLNLGHLDPIDETSGVDARLINLGFGPPGQEDRELSAEARVEALKAFQERFGLEVTGEEDDGTRRKLSQLHDAE